MAESGQKLRVRTGESERHALRQDKPIALWAVPRSISTAVDMVFVERDDFEIFHEPFSASYYYSEERLSDRYSDVEPKAEYNYQNVLANMLEPREKRVFVKDMAYHAEGLIGPEFVSRFANTFIIRDPKYVISSLYRMWPDFTFEEQATAPEEKFTKVPSSKVEGLSFSRISATPFRQDPICTIE